MSGNIGYLFYKEYFNDLKIKRQSGKPVFNGTQKSNLLINKNLSTANLLYPLPNANDFKEIELTTIYPGLLIGSGYIHEIGGVKEGRKQLVENELKLGFYFDHTTGLPVIPGSSVKGVLRSAFKANEGKYIEYLLTEELKILNLKEDENADNEDKKKLNYLCKKVKVEGEKEEVPFIVKHIFNGYHKKQKEGKVVEEPLPIYHRDKFFDAFPVAPAGQKFLADDYITPHPDPLKNPVPLRFLKVRPGVTFRFVFELHDLKNEKGETILTAEDKLKLFKRILLDLGVGAKTNVGYGQFVESNGISGNSAPSPSSRNLNRETETQNTQTEPVQNRPGSGTTLDYSCESELQKGAELEAEVTTGNNDKYYYFLFECNEKKYTIRKKKTKVEIPLSPGQKVHILVQQDYRATSPLNFVVVLPE